MEMLNNGSLVDKISPLPKEEGDAARGSNRNVLEAGRREENTQSGKE